MRGGWCTAGPLVRLAYNGGAMWRLRSCVRCGGDVFQEGTYPWEWTCLQCGGRVYVRQNGNGSGAPLARRVAPIERALPPPAPRADPPLPPRWKEMEAALALLG